MLRKTPAVKNNVAAPDLEESWNDAYVRLEDYLRALHLNDGEQRDAIILEMLARATRQREDNPELSPKTLAMQEIRASTERWFEKILSSRDRVAVAGLTALLAVDALDKWPSAFLAETIPADLQHDLAKCNVRPVPDLKVSSMVPEPFDNPLPGAIPLRNALGILARSLKLQMAKKSAPVPAESPKPPTGWPR